MLTYKSDFSRYLTELVNMEMSIQSMEVVNRFTAMVDLPTEFVHHYITNCITYCENARDRFVVASLNLTSFKVHAKQISATGVCFPGFFNTKPNSHCR